LAALPDNKTYYGTATQIAGKWAQQDPAAAASWLNTLPQGGTRDAAITGLVTVASATDPASAYTWAASTSDPKSQFNLVKTVLQQWAGTDAAAAGSALQNYEQSASLTDKQVATLNKALQNPTPAMSPNQISAALRGMGNGGGMSFGSSFGPGPSGGLQQMSNGGWSQSSTGSSGAVITTMNSP
jgi:hypothetical protein